MTQRSNQSKSPQDWWFGLADATTTGVAHTALLAERVHLSIADETFKVLNRIPVVATFSQPVQTVHHGITRTCYQSVGLASVGLNRLVRLAKSDSFF